MTLNKGMHPRNPYKDKPPDFKQLAVEFADFRKHCTLSSGGKVHVNFHEDAAVRSLTKALLKKDFGLDVNLPEGTLVPRIPQKLNYVLHIEDLLRINGICENVLGIDIGTGASCIYALLGAKLCGWKFLATDSEEASVSSAHQNVSQNNLGDKICVFHVDSDEKSLITEVVSNAGDRDISFCMCNPPFFDVEENGKRFCSLDGEIFTNKMVNEKSAPHSATIAGSNELQVEGGEVAFINRLIDDSVVLRDRIRIYTTMLGKKHSIGPLKKRLERLSNAKYSISTLNQGKTQRWILSWTFFPTISVQPLNTIITMTCKKSVLDSLDDVMKSLEAHTSRDEKSSMTVECPRVTWTHQRAKKRAEARLSAPPRKRLKLNSEDVASQASLGEGDGRDSLYDVGNFESSEVVSVNGDRADSSIQAYFPVPNDEKSTKLLRFRVVECAKDHGVELSFEMLSGAKHHLHQLIQYLKNAMKL